VEADSWDVYFPAPLSLSLVANTFAHNGMQRELGELLDLHDGQVEAIAADLRLLAPDRRLDVTAIAHHSVPGQPAMHLHVHVYVARTAVDPSTDERSPIARAELAAAATRAWERYSARLRAEATEALGIGWDPLPEDPAEGAADEVRVVGLPRALHVTGGGPGVCYGYFGPHEQIMAAERAVTIGAQPASG
jgi:diadenosine tetraphosphate (Ap4A) HIT family hydrolase